ncbi:hypothetical protein [Clostridium sp. Marseille-QA1073]
MYRFCLTKRFSTNETVTRGKDLFKIDNYMNCKTIDEYQEAKIKEVIKEYENNLKELKNQIKIDILR